MLVTLFLAMLLMTAGVGKAAVSDLQVTGKVNDRTLGSREGRQNMKKQLHHQVKALLTSVCERDLGNLKSIFLLLKVRICCAWSCFKN